MYKVKATSSDYSRQKQLNAYVGLTMRLFKRPICYDVLICDRSNRLGVRHKTESLEVKTFTK